VNVVDGHLAYFLIGVTYLPTADRRYSPSYCAEVF
jgi:hypothetical protein